MRYRPTLHLLFVAATTLAPLLPAQTRQFEVDTPAAIQARQFVRLTTADIDGDGDQDVIGWEVLFLQTGPTLLRNDGEGVFTDVTATQMPIAWLVVLQVVPFDADGDGDLDLFVSSNTQSAVLRNDGAGVFAVHQVLPPPFAYYTDAAAGDLDGDGDRDIVVAGTVFGQSMHQVLVNNGSGTLTPGPQLGQSFAAQIALVDFDGDQDLDVLFVEVPLRLLRNDGNLQFTDVSASRLQVTSSFRGVGGVVDLDGDGDLDVVLVGVVADAVLRNVVGVLIETPLPPVTVPTQSMVVGDVDRDGRPDLVRSNDQSGVELLRNLGGGVFVSAPQRLPASPVLATLLRLADLDRDGDPELLGCRPYSPTLVLANRDLDLTADPAVIGQNWSLRVTSQPGYANAPRLARLGIGLLPLSPPLPIPGFGELQIDLEYLVLLLDAALPAPAGQFSFPVPVPNLPALIGLTVYVQALVERGTGPVLSNRTRTTIS